ncbi:MAG: DUF177 domain-containing protein [Pseudomonadota bacterium]
MAHDPVLPLAKLPADGPHRIEWTPTEEDRAALVAALDLLDLRKLRAAFTLTPRGTRDWHLSAAWGATLIQPCVVTLAPVTTRIDRTDALIFTANMPEITEAESEMPEDDTLEPLVDAAPILPLIQEMLALALPPYPRADDAELGEAVFAAPDVRPMTDEDAKPFAGLAALKSKLEGGE